MFTPNVWAERIGWSLWRVVRCAGCWRFKNATDRRQAALGRWTGCAGRKAMSAPVAAWGGAINPRRVPSKADIGAGAPNAPASMLCPYLQSPVLAAAVEEAAEVEILETIIRNTAIRQFVIAAGRGRCRSASETINLSGNLLRSAALERTPPMSAGPRPSACVDTLHRQWRPTGCLIGPV